MCHSPPWEPYQQTGHFNGKTYENNPVYFHDPNKQRDFFGDMLQKYVIEPEKNLEIFEVELLDPNRDVIKVAMAVIQDTFC